MYRLSRARTAQPRRIRSRRLSRATIRAVGRRASAVIDRQPGPALETSFANAGEVSPGYSSPWAGP